jgi:hypothetical protein
VARAFRRHRLARRWRQMDRVLVLLDTSATKAESARVRSLLREVGLDADPEPVVPPQGDAPWLVLIAMPVTAFLTAIASEAGKDAWTRLKKLFEDLAAARGGGRRQRSSREGSRPRFGQLVVRPNVVTRPDFEPVERGAVLMGWIPSGDTSTELSLATDLPDDAFRKLFELEIPSDGAFLFWDYDRAEWRSTPKRANPDVTSD